MAATLAVEILNRIYLRFAFNLLTLELPSSIDQRKSSRGDIYPPDMFVNISQTTGILLWMLPTHVHVIL